MKQKSGFTFIELIIYIALLSIFLTGSILFTWDVIYGSAKSNVEQEVHYNLRHAVARVSYEIRNASGIQTFSNTQICLRSTDPGHDPMRIFINNHRLNIAWGGGNCNSETYTMPLTSSEVRVTGLTFTNLSSADLKSKHIAFSITIEYASLGTRKEFNLSRTYEGSAEIRSN